MEERGELHGQERFSQVEQAENGFDVAESGSTEVGARNEVPPDEALTEAPAVSVSLPIAPTAQRTKDPVLKQVEEILEEDLGETYSSLSPELRVKFKQQGELVAISIQRMIGGAKIQVKKVLHLLVSWLRIIPHINRFFLEQEAKIKTDRIIALAEREKQKHL
jgi:hypothetical protein